MKNYDFATLLRIFGGTALVGSATIFLVQGLQTSGSFTRFSVFFGLVLVLAGAGHFCARKWNEAKGARSFLALMTAGIAVQVAQVGAMVFSLFKGTSTDTLPEVFNFAGTSLFSTAIAAGATLLILFPLCYLGFKVLARPMAKDLSLTYLAANLLLLVPLRDPVWTSLLLLLEAAIMIPVVRKFNRDPVFSKIEEGRWAQLILAIPLLITMGRGMFYEAGLGLSASFAIVTSVGLLAILREFKVEGGIKVLGEVAAFFGILYGSIYWGNEVAHSFGLKGAVQITMVCLPAILMLLAAERVKLFSRAYYQLASVMGLMLTGGLLLFFEFGASTIALFMAAGFMTLAYKRLDRSIFEVSAFLTAASFISLIAKGMYQISAVPWIVLAILGVALILGASWAEKHWPRMKVGYLHLMQRFPKQTVTVGQDTSPNSL